MRFKTLMIAVALTVFAVSPAEAWQKNKSKSKPDLISGNWNTSLVAAGNSTFTLTMKLKLEGDKVAGSYESDHAVLAKSAREPGWRRNSA